MTVRGLFSGSRVDDRDLGGLRRVAVALAIALLILNVVDIAATNRLVGSLGAIEVNPLMAPLVGTPWMVVLKVGIPAAVISLATRISSRRSVASLSIVVGIYVLVAAINLGQIVYVYA